MDLRTPRARADRLAAGACFRHPRGAAHTSCLTPPGLTLALAARTATTAAPPSPPAPPALTVALATRQESSADPPCVRAPPAVASSGAVSGRKKPEFAMADLAPFIRETARRVHGRYYSLHRQAAMDFIAQSPALV